jgi:tetratricopeptide (TPR) repeat protein
MTAAGPGGTDNTISGGVHFGPVLQGRDIQAGFNLPAEAPAALAQLPAPVTGFTGRDRELESLSALMRPAAREGPLVVSIAGPPGVGKTALAVEAGRAALRHGWYGGVLFIDLHGYDEAPLAAANALSVLLRALGVRAEFIPDDAEERAGLYRSVLAQVSDPVLLIADNASSEAQVRPLLPGSAAHAVLVTSRHTLAGLDARLLDVTIMDDAASVALLDEALRSAHPGDDRISVDGSAAGRLAAACGGLPLALRIVAAILRADPTRRVVDLSDTLAEERERLRRLRYDDGSSGGLSVKAAFELSYRALDETAARMFRLLSLGPGPSLSTGAAAVLADLPADDARDVLAGLLRAHLIEPAPGAADRWRRHDLLRLYADELSDAETDPDLREHALDRLFDYYLIRAQAAKTRLLAPPGAQAPGHFSDRETALAWLDAERPGLVSAIFKAASARPHPIAYRLPVILAEYFSRRRHLDDWLATADVALTIANGLGDLDTRAEALNNLGWALHTVRRFDEAIVAHQKAAATWRILGNSRGEGIAWHNLGMSLHEMRRFDEAITAFRLDLAICREARDQRGEGVTLNSLGLSLREAGRPAEAITVLRDSVAIWREIGDPHEEAMALNNLAAALANQAVAEFSAAEESGAISNILEYFSESGRKEQQLNEAIACGQRALALLRQVDDGFNVGMTLLTLSGLLYNAKRADDAIASAREAAITFAEVGHQHGRGLSLTNLATILRQVDRFDEALAAEHAEEAFAAEREAAGIFHETGDRYHEGQLLDNLGISLREAGRLDEAIAAHRDAAAILREFSDREEGWALLNLCSVLHEAGRVSEAITTAERAVELFRDVDDQRLLGRALRAHGAALYDAGRPEEAVAAQQAALAIFRDVGDILNEGVALYDLGLTRHQMRRLDEAITALDRAAAIGGAAGDVPLQRRALLNLGLSLYEGDRFDETNPLHEAAAEILVGTGSEPAKRWAENKLRSLRTAGRRRPR